MVSPGSSRTSQIRTCSFSSTMRWPTSPSVMPRAAAACRPCGSLMVSTVRASPSRSFRNDCDGVDLDQVVGRHHLGDLDHGGGGQGWLEIFPAHGVDRLEVLHVAHIDVDAADMIERAACGLDRGLDVLANLPGLHGDVADSGDQTVRAARRHAGDEDQPALRLDHGGLREVADRLAQLVARYFKLGHVLTPGWIAFRRARAARPTRETRAPSAPACRRPPAGARPLPLPPHSGAIPVRPARTVA